MRRGFRWYGDRHARAVREAARQGLYEGAEHLLGLSQQEVPHDEGTLSRSGTASVDEVRLYAAVAYDTPYAAKQHEDRTLSHPNGRKAKYLEDPANANADAIMAYPAARIREVRE